MVSETHSGPGYAVFWRAWFVLLLITLAMIFIRSESILILGMCLKASIILFWFMHLKYERLSLSLSVVLGIFLTTAVLMVLIAYDGWLAGHPGGS